ncbi:MAG: serine/threonine-protein kinase [Lachnospiraceae bacterium]|nr:serine/threonine-protein kinase [Lachnospiraceae bacterium]
MRKKERLEVGYRLNGRYRVCHSLGQGGFGITYLAEDELLGQKIVIKEYFPAAFARRAEDGSIRITEETDRDAFTEGRNRFLREARILTSLLDVPGVVKAWNYFQENQTAYLVMEYVQGISLRSWLEQNGEVSSFDEASEMLRPVVLALASIHKKGLLHRDITPDNLMVGENGAVKLLDFGSARSYLREKDSEMTQTVLLKSGYAPPEQYDGKSAQGPWTDIYALSATLYEMITGCMPEDALQRQVRDELIAPSVYGAKMTPEQEEHLLKKGLALDERERYASIQEFSADFYPQEKMREVRYGRNGRRMAVAGGGVLAAGLLLAFGLYEFGVLGDTHTEKRAGDLDRGSREYEAFLEFVKTHGESTKEGNTYTLNESDVRQIDLPGNLYYDIDSTEEAVLAILQEAEPSWDLEPDGSAEQFTVTTGDYGIIQTDFTVEDRYLLPDGIRVILDYDYNNGKLHEIRILPGQETNCETAALLTQTLLENLCHEEPETDLGGMAAAMREIQEKIQSGALTYTAWYQGNLIVQLYEEPSGATFRTGIRIRRNTENAAAYHW